MSEPPEVEVPEEEKKLDRESAAAEKSLDKLTDRVVHLHLFSHPPPFVTCKAVSCSCVNYLFRSGLSAAAYEKPSLRRRAKSGS